jgi:hypothetical protein
VLYIKQWGANVAPCFLAQLYNQHCPQGLEKFFWFCSNNITPCAGGVVLNLKHNKQPLPNVWPIDLSTSITQCEVNVLSQASFVLIYGAPLVAPTIEFNELHILLGVFPNNRNGCKICVRQCLPTNMFRMKNATTLDAKVVNITFTPQRHTYIYDLLVHEFIVNNQPCTYFVSIDVFPRCTCSYLVSNVASCRHNYFLSHEHMY